jgi:hypothetical protein
MLCRPRRPRLPSRRAAACVCIAATLVACGSTPSRRVPWETVRDSANDSFLTLSYGLDSCQDLDRVEVGYARAAVTVTIFGVSNGRACTGLRFVRSVDVPLRQRLAGRRVEDGARAG